MLCNWRVEKMVAPVWSWSWNRCRCRGSICMLLWLLAQSALHTLQSFHATSRKNNLATSSYFSYLAECEKGLVALTIIQCLVLFLWSCALNWTVNSEVTTVQSVTSQSYHLLLRGGPVHSALKCFIFNKHPLFIKRKFTQDCFHLFALTSFEGKLTLSSYKDKGNWSQRGKQRLTRANV